MPQVSLAELSRWLFVRGWFLWGSAFLVLIGAVVLYYVPITNDNLRRLGMLYETSGTLTVLADIIKIIRAHKLRPWQDLLEYFRAHPFRARAPINLAGSSSTQSSASGSLSVGVKVIGTLEERVESLEKRMDGAESGMDRAHRRITAEEQARANADQAEASARLQGDAELREGIKSSEVGNLYPTVVGLMWLLIGMAMTTGTNELCSLLGCLPEHSCPVQKNEGSNFPPPAWPSVRT